MAKAEYETPELTEMGSFEAMTQGGSAGTVLDVAFSAGTPIADLTFS